MEKRSINGFKNGEENSGLLATKNKKYIYIILVLLFTIIFKTNCIDSWNRNYSGFQYDSEDLVIGEITAVRYNIDTGWYGLGRMNYKEPEKGYVSEKIYKEKGNSQENLCFLPYDSQIGLQGKVFSLISSVIYSSQWIGIFKWINCLLLALVIVYILYLLNLKYSTCFSFVWGITFLFSPWIVNFAPNLYWVEFTWFLPMLIGLLIVSDKVNFKFKTPVLFCATFIAIFIKSLCGYEYLSTIMLSMVLFIVSDLVKGIVTCNKEEVKRLFKILFGISICGLLGFALALCIHGYYRGNGDIFNGLNNIYQQDILRRTSLGNDANFQTNNLAIKSSLEASIGSVVKMYFDYYKNYFHYNILLWIDGRNFRLMTFLASVFILLRIYCRKFTQKNNIEYLTLLFLSMIASLSWIILAKSHSYIHIHMNYVLWFFGYVQMCLFIILDTSLNLLKEFMNEGEKNV